MATDRSVQMTKASYRLACLEAKPRLAQIQEFPFDLNGSCRFDAGGVGVYVACTANMTVAYVGSIHRPDNPFGLADRIEEHRAKFPERRAQWRYIWFVPMHLKSSLAEVRRAEARIGTLLSPSMSRRLPIG